MKNKTGTKEWADRNMNVLLGCSHDCKYCYAKAMAVRFGRCQPNQWKFMKNNFQQLSMEPKRYDGLIMFPSSHDIVPEKMDECLGVILKHLKVGNKLLIVSKPYYECIETICNETKVYKSQILFRFSIGSTNDTVLKLWEPNAPDFNERLKALEFAFNSGYQTSVSCEPMLDNRVDDVIQKVIPFITETIWIGKVNRLHHNLSVNGYGNDSDTLKQAAELISWQCDENILHLFCRYKENTIIKWKDSIQKVLKKYKL